MQRKRMFALVLVGVLAGAGCGLSQVKQAEEAGKTETQSAGKVVGDANAQIMAARAASKEKHYAEAEGLMLPLTAQQPQMVLPWVELGLAQIGLAKYAEAEHSFEVVLGMAPYTPGGQAGGGAFYVAPDAKGVVAPDATRVSRNTMGGATSNAQKRSPEILGVAYASLGEIAIHEGKIKEAQGYYDRAVEAYPSDGALYRRNETIFFFQAGDGDAQLDAAEKAIALDPNRALLYYMKGQALVAKATLDAKTQKMLLPAGCAEAYQKYLALEPKGQFSADARSILASAGLAAK